MTDPRIATLFALPTHLLPDLQEAQDFIFSYIDAGKRRWDYSLENTFEQLVGKPVSDATKPHIDSLAEALAAWSDEMTPARYDAWYQIMTKGVDDKAQWVSIGNALNFLHVGKWRVIGKMSDHGGYSQRDSYLHFNMTDGERRVINGSRDRTRLPDVWVKIFAPMLHNPPEGAQHGVLNIEDIALDIHDLVALFKMTDWRHYDAGQLLLDAFAQPDGFLGRLLLHPEGTQELIDSFDPLGKPYDQYRSYDTIYGLSALDVLKPVLAYLRTCPYDLSGHMQQLHYNFLITDADKRETILDFAKARPDLGFAAFCRSCASGPGKEQLATYERVLRTKPDAKRIQLNAAAMLMAMEGQDAIPALQDAVKAAKKDAKTAAFLQQIIDGGGAWRLDDQYDLTRMFPQPDWQPPGPEGLEAGADSKPVAGFVTALLDALKASLEDNLEKARNRGGDTAKLEAELQEANANYAASHANLLSFILDGTFDQTTHRYTRYGAGVGISKTLTGLVDIKGLTPRGFLRLHRLIFGKDMPCWFYSPAFEKDKVMKNIHGTEVEVVLIGRWFFDHPFDLRIMVDECVGLNKLVLAHDEPEWRQRFEGHQNDWHHDEQRYADHMFKYFCMPTGRSYGASDMGIEAGAIAHYPGDLIWPAFTQHPESKALFYELGMLDPAAHYTSSGGYKEPHLNAAMMLLAKFPELPDVLGDIVFEEAMAGRKTSMPFAHMALPKVRDAEARLKQAVASKKASDRAAAIEALAACGWLDDALLKTLMEGEKTAKIAKRLEELASTRSMADTPPVAAALQIDVEKELAKAAKIKLAASIDAVDFDLFPDLVWKDSGKTLERNLRDGIIKMALRTRKVTPPPLLAPILDAFTDDSVANLALAAGLTHIELQFRQVEQGWEASNKLGVRDAWEVGYAIRNPAYAEEDNFSRIEILGYNLSEVATIAAEDRPGGGRFKALVKDLTDKTNTHIRHLASHLPNGVYASMQLFDEAEVAGLIGPVLERSNVPLPRDPSRKGLMGFWAARPCEAAVAAIEAALGDVSSNEFNMAKDLLDVLDLMDLDSGIARVVQAASSHRMNGVRKHAAKLIEVIAARRGWTAAELADRSIPGFGFSSDGRGELDYGDRKIPLVLTEALEIMVVKPDGKLSKTAPAARKGEDEELVKEERSRLTRIRRELKKAIARLEDSLTVDMITQRAWSAANWQAHLAAHPVAGRMCQRLVWLAHGAEGTSPRSFRRSEDGSLIDAADEVVALTPDNTVTLAHHRLLDAAAIDAWRSHFTDYEITPFIAQMDGARCPLTDQKGGLGDADAFDGFGKRMVGNFDLRKWARQHGFSRGEVIDGGGYCDYIREWPVLDMVVKLNFDGEEFVGNDDAHDCVIESMQFHPMGRNRPAMRLADVPPILLDVSHGAMAALERYAKANA